MGRRPKERQIQFLPLLNLFVPKFARGAPTEGTSVLGLDELEALRLAHIEGMDQAAAAKVLGVSRPTFGRILHSAHRRVAHALVEGRALSIAGGRVALQQGPMLCTGCDVALPPRVLRELPKPVVCPDCRGELRDLEEGEIPHLTQQQLVHVGRGLGPSERRAFLMEALRAANPTDRPASKPEDDEEA